MIFGDPGDCTQQVLVGVAQSRHTFVRCTVSPWQRRMDNGVKGNNISRFKKVEKASKMPVMHCSWGTCSSDSRSPQFCDDIPFVLLAKSTWMFETCLHWIKAYRCPRRLYNVSKIISFFLSLKVVGILHMKGVSEPVKWPLASDVTCPVAFCL